VRVRAASARRGLAPASRDNTDRVYVCPELGSTQARPAKCPKPAVSDLISPPSSKTSHGAMLAATTTYLPKDPPPSRSRIPARGINRRPPTYDHPLLVRYDASTTLRTRVILLNVRVGARFSVRKLLRLGPHLRIITALQARLISGSARMRRPSDDPSNHFPRSRCFLDFEHHENLSRKPYYETFPSRLARTRIRRAPSPRICRPSSSFVILTTLASGAAVSAPI